ncbi:MAG: PEP-CTERM sorting domain-containing protein [Pseudomonadota bacterium]
MTSITRAIIGLALLAAAATTAHAAELTVRFDGFAAGSRNGNIFGPNPNQSQSVAAGQFSFDVLDDPMNAYWDNSIAAFCIDVNNALVTGQNVTYTIASAESHLSATQFSNIGWLYDNFADGLGSSVYDAAFQLALWELMYDSDPLSLLNGADRGTFWSSGFGGARNDGQSWLDTLTQAGPAGQGYRASNYELFVLLPHNPTNNQTLIIARPVPEPTVVALLGLGLLLMVALRRRQVLATAS